MGFVIQNDTSVSFFGGFVGICIVMAINTFRFRDNRNRQHYLLIPASTGEKLITTLVDVHLIQPVLVILAMTLGLCAGIFTQKIFGWHNSDVNTFAVISNFLHGSLLSIDFILGLVLTQAIFIFGNLYFKTKAWLKVILSFIVFFIILGIIDVIILRFTLHPSLISGTGFALFIPNVPFLGNINLSCLSIIIPAVLIVVFWVLSFFKLRETEV
ncbi:hypothetical protein FACS1894180_2790 [Bacteroidia bacterium]|nr:hypothetical protein FACS1894180_2790 [Bacteroidia bacterium]